MSLLVVISKDSTSYNIKCESVEHTYTRLPTQAGFPGEEGTEPLVITIDLGICIQQITLLGTVDSVSPGAGYPSKTNLEEISATWWAYGDTEENLPTLQISSGSYRVVLKSASFRQEGGIEDRWVFNLLYLVRSKVS